MSNLCAAVKTTRFVCLEENGSHYASDSQSDCDYPLQGQCSSGRFRSGLERFYIPESEASSLDKAVRNGEGSIVVSVTHSGTKTVKALLINGKSWKSAN